MITKEVREWIEKVKRHQYSYENAMYEFNGFIRYLTRDEILFLKKILENEDVKKLNKY